MADVSSRSSRESTSESTRSSRAGRSTPPATRARGSRRSRSSAPSAGPPVPTLTPFLEEASSPFAWLYQPHTVTGLVVLVGVIGLVECLGDLDDLVADGIAGGNGRFRSCDGLGCDEQWHIGRRFFKNQPRLRFALRSYDRALGGVRVTRGEQIPDLDRLGLVDAGLRTAGPVVELGQRVEHPPTGGAEPPGQVVDSQPLRQVLVRDRGRLPRRRGFGLLSEVIVGHVFSLSPRARLVDAATRGLPLLVRACWPGLSGVWLNDGPSTVRATSQAAMVAHV